LFPRIILISALVAYIGQNLFFFDNPSSLLGLSILFVVALHHPTNTQSKSNKSERLLWITILIPILGFLLVINPTWNQLTQIAEISTPTETTITNADEHIKALASLTFVFDPQLQTSTLTNLLADTYQSTDRPADSYTEAIEQIETAFDDALTSQPKSVKLWYEYSLFTLLRGFITQSTISQTTIDQFVEIQKASPYRVELLSSVADMYQHNGNTDQAISTIKEALDAAPDHAGSKWALGNYLAETGYIAAAGPLAIEGIRAGFIPHSAAQLSWVISYALEQGDFDTVIYLYERAVIIEPNNLPLLPTLAAFYAENGQLELAAQTATKLKTLDPSSAAIVDDFLESIGY
ncbi:hypothetical protein HOI18_03795, partial [Candidatus Uhrbacteria bacterium]|nr:hypothetical protein [Candidatus Uhrbacteria bacterium]